MKLSLATAALLLLSFAPAPSAQGHVARAKPTSFVFRTSWRGFETGTHTTALWPWAARVGDLDGDRRPDVAVVDWYGMPKLGVLLNRGDGRLEQPTQYSLPRGALDLVIADFTLDGAADIVTSNSGSNYDGSTVSLFRNRGDGTFTAGTQFSVGTGGFVHPVGVAAADFSGDGRVDLCVARNGYLGQGNLVALLVNDGAGGFLPAASFPAGDAPYKLAAGDMDGDGRPDLVVARQQQQLSILRSSGAGFAPPVSYDVSVFDGSAYPTVELADVDRDGDLDVLFPGTAVTTDIVTGIALLRNRGDGTLLPAEALYIDPEDGGAVDLAVGDVDEDGWPDLLSANDPHWTLFLGDGAGGFRAPIPFGATEAPIAIELADMDGDRHLDPLVLGRESLEVAVYRNPGNGAFATPAPRPAVADRVENVPSIARGTDAADIDGDGDLDVAVAFSRVRYAVGGISILRNRGNGSFDEPVEYLSPLHAMHVELADLDGDALPDLLWSDDAPPYDVKTRRNLGGGIFGPLTNWPMNTCGNGEVTAVDVEGDGDLDIALCEYLACPSTPNSGRRIFIRRNAGDGTFAAPYVHLVSGFPERIVAADVDGDGHDDLLVTGNSWIDVSLANGDGTFRPPLAAACDWGPKGFCVGDFDADGALDLATTNYGDVGSGGESVSVLLGYGDGTFRFPVTRPGSFSHTFGNVRDIVAGDPDGDGDLDLMASNYGSLDVSLFENRGDGTFASQQRYGTGCNTLDLVFGDFSGDGRGDLLAQVSFGQAITFRPGLVLLRASRR